MRLVLVALLLLVALPAAAHADDQGPPTVTGLAGRVVLALRCPVPLGDDDGVCPEAPFPTTIGVRSSDGALELAQVTTESDGSFWVPLDAGDYLLEVPRVAGSPQVTRDLPVTIVADGPTTLTVRIPSGTRSAP